MGDSENILETVRRVISVVSRNLRRYVQIVLATAVITLGLSFVLPNYYESTVRLLPSATESTSSLLANLSGLASLAGISTGSVTPEMLYPEILLSEAVLKPIIHTRHRTSVDSLQQNLIEYWDIEEDSPVQDFEAALENLQDELQIALDNETFVVSVTWSSKDSVFTASVLNAIVEQLDLFMRTQQTTTARNQRVFIEERLNDVSRQLELSETTLKNFKEKNRRIVDSPELLMEQERLSRDVLINTTLYIELKKQYELIRIEEVKNTPFVTIMDQARPAGDKVSPKRAVLALVASFLVGFLLAAYSLLSEFVPEAVQIIHEILPPKLRKYLAV